VHIPSTENFNPLAAGRVARRQADQRLAQPYRRWRVGTESNREIPMGGIWCKGMWLALLAVCVLFLYQGMSHLNKVRDQLAQVREANTRLDMSNRALYRRVSRLRGDREALSRAVRLETGYIRPDEVVYFVGPTPAPKPAK